MKVEFLELQEPVPHTAKDSVSAEGRTVLSQQGTGGGTYPIEGRLEPGEFLSMSASCGPGDEVAITLNHPLGGVTFPCANPSGSWLTSKSAGGVIGDMTVTVKTAHGGPFWVTAWAHQGSTSTP